MPSPKTAAPTSLAQLSTLAMGLTANAGIRLRSGASSWCWMPATREIGVVDADLVRLPSAAALGIIAHETGHALGSDLTVDIGLSEALDAILPFTRLDWRREARDRLERHFRLPMLNGLEDGRVEAMMVHRFPAAQAWLTAASQALRGTKSDLRAALHINQISMVLADIHYTPHLQQGVYPASLLASTIRGTSNYEAILSLYTKSLPFDVAPAVVAAVRAVRPAVFAFRDTFPQPGTRCWQRATPSGAVERLEADSPQAAVQAAAAAAAAIAATRITPTLAALLLADLRWMASWAPTPLHPFQLSLLCASRPRGQMGPTAVQEHNLIAVIRALTATVQPLAGTIVLPPTLDPKQAAAAMARLQMHIYVEGNPPSPQEVHQHAAALTRLLRTRFPARRRGHAPKALHEAGLRPHLPAVIRRAAQPQASDRIWRRPPPRDHHDAACLLLIDVSGSMLGDKIAWVTAAVEVIGRALSTLEIPYALQGYQDQRIPLLPIGLHPVEALVAALPGLEAEVRGARPGGHNCPDHNDDGPCLDEAAAQLAAVPATDRLLIMISDGELNGARSTQNDLVAALGRWRRPQSPVRLLGVGAGPDHNHMRRRHPEGVMTACLPALPRLLAAAVGRMLMNSPS